MRKQYRREDYTSQATINKRRANAPMAAGQILSLALKRQGLDKQVARYEFVLHWREIVGDAIANRATPEAIQGKALVVRVSNPQWAQELTFQKDIIINRLNKFLSDQPRSHGAASADLVEDLRFVVGARAA